MKEMLRMADKSKVDEVKQMLEYTQKGTAKATVGNYMVVLRNDPLVRESMKYNKLTGRIDIVKKLWWNEEICKLDDDGRTYFYYFFERYYKLTSEKCMDKALRIEANSRAYHPICEYLEQLEWDGQERIRYVLQRYMGADASDFVYEVVKHFLMEALSRIYRPGCKADEMLCLVGQQGAGKSTFFRFLALNDDWFSDDLKQLNDSKIYEHLRGHWIMEMSEMIAAISAKSNEEIKSFLTRQKDTYRNPYDKYEEDRKRQCIFAGSTNTRQFIPFDRTGARRFLPIAIDSSKAEKHILDDEKEARAYFDQLWAEAMEIYWSKPMALFYLSVTQTKRSAGQSAIASAAYRAGERLYSEYYGEYSDYTRKGGVICSDILLPSHAPPEYADRQTLWNAVEKAERGKNARLAYSFDIALQNEFSLEENIALARQFLLENFVSRGMVVDFAVHQPDREDGSVPNPHFHVLCPIRPIEQNGKWGLKQRRVYELDEDGNRIRDADGKFVFNAVPTTDWGSPETLEHWREAWAELCNAKFAEKGIDVRIDHRSYERQGVELFPTVHEGATVQAMEKKGIRTEKGEFNRWIRATNAVIRDIKKKIALLFDWIAEAKAELAKPQAPDLVSLLSAYYTQRRAGAYSQKGKVSNLKEMNETFNYLRANGIYSLEDLESRVSEHSAATESLKKTLDEQTARMKAIKQLYDSSAAFQNLKPVYDGLQKIKFEKPRAKYKAEHEAELIQFYAARRKLTEEFPDGKVDMKKLSDEYDELEQAHESTYGEFKAVRDDLHRLWKVKSCVDTAARFNERTEEQKLQNRPQTRQKKEELSR